MKTADHVLLTGAGFTHNFGAPLAVDMWSLLLGHSLIRRMSRIRRILLENFDFESAYDQVILSTEYSEEEKAAMHNAVAAVYNSLDDGLRGWNSRLGAPYPVNLYGVRRLMEKFGGTRGSPGLFFTLNQDLFIERYYADGPTLQLPGLDRAVHLPSRAQGMLDLENRIVLPATLPSIDDSVQRDTFFYVKLHGSCNWYASDGRQRMVIGHGKADQIAKEPLLTAYLDLFRRVLASGNKRLLVIGYGFRDTHINCAIADAIRQGTLELFVVSPQQASYFRKSLEEVPHGTDIWPGLHGYYPQTLRAIFPQNQEETQEWRHLRCNFFSEGA